MDKKLPNGPKAPLTPKTYVLHHKDFFAFSFAHSSSYPSSRIKDINLRVMEFLRFFFNEFVFGTSRKSVPISFLVTYQFSPENYVDHDDYSMEVY